MSNVTTVFAKAEGNGVLFQIHARKLRNLQKLALQQIRRAGAIQKVQEVPYIKSHER